MKYLSTFVLACIILTACKKDKVEPQECGFDDEFCGTVYYSAAGDTMNSTYYEQVAFPVPFTISWDNDNLYGIGEDSLDIDQDGAIDIVFHLNIINPDSAHLISGLPDPFPSLLVSGNGTYEVAMTIESYPIGMGQTTSFSWVSALNEGDYIYPELTWSALGNPKYMWMQHAVTALSNGPWSNFGVGYLALRKVDKFGWVKLDLTDSTNPMILEYCMQ